MESIALQNRPCAKCKQNPRALNASYCLDCKRAISEMERRKLGIMRQDRTQDQLTRIRDEITIAMYKAMDREDVRGMRIFSRIIDFIDEDEGQQGQ